jgi:hypothetical protein
MFSAKKLSMYSVDARDGSVLGIDLGSIQIQKYLDRTGERRREPSLAKGTETKAS